MGNFGILLALIYVGVIEMIDHYKTMKECDRIEKELKEKKEKELKEKKEGILIIK